MEELFAYGTLNDPSKQRELFGHEIAGTPDALPDHATIELVEDGVAYRAAVSRPGETIEGRVLEVMEAGLRAADAWEGESYVRERKKLRSGREAWVYLRKRES